MSRSVQLLLAIVLGALAGLFLGPRAELLGELGLIVIRALKWLAMPLIFFAVADAFVKTPIGLRKAVTLLRWSATNAVVAGMIAIALSNSLPLARVLDLGALRRSILGKAAPDLGPGALHFHFGANSALIGLVTAVICGLFLRKTGGRGAVLLDRGLKALVRILEWVVFFVPLAAFGVIARSVGFGGLRIFQALSVFVALIVAGLALQVLAYYPLLLKVFTKVHPIQFLKHASDPLLTAFSTGSSLATLPVTLNALDQRLKLKISSSRLAACIGTNLNHDGILLYEAAAALFIAQVMGIHLHLLQQIFLVGTSTLAAVGIAGIPDAGLITLSLVFSATGLPLAAVPFLLPVDWFIGRLRATTNVASDMVVATLLDQKR